MAEELGKASSIISEIPHDDVMEAIARMLTTISTSPLSFEPAAAWKIRDDEVTELDGSTWFRIRTTISGPKYGSDLAEHSVQFEAMLEKDQEIYNLTMELAITAQGPGGAVTSTSNVTINANGQWETITSPNLKLISVEDYAEVVVSYTGSQKAKGLSFKTKILVR